MLLTYVIWQVFNQKHFTRQNQLKFIFVNIHKRRRQFLKGRGLKKFAIIADDWGVGVKNHEKILWRWAIHFCRYPSLESCANPPFVRWGLSTPEQYATSKKQKIREINVGSYLTYVIWRVFNQKHFTRQNQLKFMFSDFCQVGAFDSRTIRDI